MGAHDEATVMNWLVYPSSGQEVKEFREEMKEIRGELAEIKVDNRMINEKLDRLTEAAMAVR